jgi:sugar (pentulose or hexulose) kinase
MQATPVILIFDIGKTNKKLLLLDEDYKLVHEVATQFNEIIDEDGFACEDLNKLTNWILAEFQNLLTNNAFEIKAVNFSGYGASFVYLDEAGKPLLPLYNYLKPYPPALSKQFYKAYGGESMLAKQSASPVLGSLNSGLQLYRIKYEKPAIYKQIKYALHLPQYLSFILTKTFYTDLTSIGCHTHLWDFQNSCYHHWVNKEGIDSKLAPIKNSNSIAGTINDGIQVGVGLHDSSSALIPYLVSFTEPFVLLSTGTWCITLHPFNHTILSDYELHQDCLCYLSYKGLPVKASRLFAGYEHEQQVKKLAAHFNQPADYYKTLAFNAALLTPPKKIAKTTKKITGEIMLQQSAFSARSLSDYVNYEAAYHQLIADIIDQQTKSTNLVLSGSMVHNIFVVGGFSSNPVYMNLLAAAFPNNKVSAASVPQASAIGAALAIHQYWNTKPFPRNLIQVQ